MGRLIMGYWRCKYCESYDIRGDKRECPNCGKSRDSNTKFYMKDPTDYIAPEDEAPFRRGPDWICPSCDSLNNAGLTGCKSCGTPRAESSASYTPKKETPAPAKAKELPQTEPAQSATPEDESTRTTHWFFTFIAVLLCVGILLNPLLDAISNVQAYIASLPLPPMNVTVVNFSWSREITVEEEQVVSESDWDLPPTATLTASKEEIHHYDQKVDHYETRTRQVSRREVSGYETRSRQVTKEVDDGYETRSRQVSREEFDGYETVVVGYRDLGNGAFEEITEREATYRTVYETEYYEVPKTRTIKETEYYEEPTYRTVYDTEEYRVPIYREDPVYATKYYYTIPRMFITGVHILNGEDQDPAWPEVALGTNEREFSRREVYLVTVIDEDGQTETYNMDYELWSQITVGDPLILQEEHSGTFTFFVPEQVLDEG